MKGERPLPSFVVGGGGDSRASGVASRASRIGDGPLPPDEPPGEEPATEPVAARGSSGHLVIGSRGIARFR